MRNREVFDFLLLLPSLGITRVGHVHKDIFFLADGLKNLGYRVAVLFLPQATVELYSALRKEKKIKLREYIVGLVSCLSFTSRFSYLGTALIVSKVGGVVWPSLSSQRMFFWSERVFLQSSRLVFNTTAVAYYIASKKHQIRSYYLVYHNHEKDYLSSRQIVSIAFAANHNKIVTSERTRKMLNLDPRCKMDVAVDSEVIAYTSVMKRLPYTVLVPLRKAPLKGAKFAIAAIRSILNADPRIVVYTFGDYPYVYPHRRCINMKMVNKKILASLYARCELFVLPSTEEGMPNTLLEAIANGCIVVSTDVGGVEDVITNGINGVIIPAMDAKAIERAVLHLETHRELIEKFRANSIEVAERFSVGNMAKSFIAAVSYYEGSTRYS